VGGASGQVGEHQGITAELVDVQAALDGGQSRLFAWRPSVVAARRGTSVGSGARWPLASEDWSGRSPVLTRGQSRRLPTGLRLESAGHRRCARWTRRQLFLVPLLHEALMLSHVGEGGGDHGKRSEVRGRVESLVRQHDGDVASPSCGHAEDMAVAVWAAHRGWEGRWRAVVGAQGAMRRAVAKPPQHHHAHASRTRGHGPSWSAGMGALPIKIFQ
jgi:hypothetical protein